MGKGGRKCESQDLNKDEEVKDKKCLLRSPLKSISFKEEHISFSVRFTPPSPNLGIKANTGFLLTFCITVFIHLKKWNQLTYIFIL